MNQDPDLQNQYSIHKELSDLREGLLKITSAQGQEESKERGEAQSSTSQSLAPSAEKSHKIEKHLPLLYIFFIIVLILTAANMIILILTNQQLQAKVEALEKKPLTNNVVNQGLKESYEFQTRNLMVADQDLQARVTELENYLAGNVTKLQEVEKNLAKDVANQMSASQNVQAETASLRKNVTSYEQQLKELKAEVIRIGHKESGNLSQFWRVAPNPLGYGSGERCKRQAVRFERPFSKEPKLIVSFTMIDSASSTNLRLKAYPEKVTVNGFEFVCCTWDNSIVHGFIGTWTAYEN